MYSSKTKKLGEISLLYKMLAARKDHSYFTLRAAYIGSTMMDSNTSEAVVWQS